MNNIFKGQVLLYGGLLVGACLAYPVILAKYFYDKSEIDLVVYGVLFVTSFYAFWRLFSQKAWFKNGAFILLILPLGWLKLEFWLYSEISSPQFITYLLLILLAGTMGAIMRFNFVPNAPRSVKLMVIPTTIIGFVISYFSREHSFTELMTIFFAVGLASFYWKKSKVGASFIVLLAFTFTIMMSLLDSPKFLERQAKYHDKVVFSQATDLQAIDVTEWRGNHWFYADGVNQFSTIDSWLFYEPFVFPMLELAQAKDEILVIGGENGMLIKALKDAGVQNIKLVPIDEELVTMAQNETLFTTYNSNSLSGEGIQILQEDVFAYLSSNLGRFDLIFVDVADPIDLARNQYFTKEFYQLISGALNQEALFITQSGSPYFATEAFEVVQKTIKSAGFDLVAYHNQILTLGEWSWTIGAKHSTRETLKERLSESSFEAYKTQWLNQEAMQMMLSFGKPTRVTTDLKVNTMTEPTLYQYYLNGNYTLR